MKNIQVVDIEAIEKMIYNWNQNHSKQFRNDKSMISKDVQECFQHWIGLEPFEFFQYITSEYKTGYKDEFVNLVFCGKVLLLNFLIAHLVGCL